MFNRQGHDVWLAALLLLVTVGLAPPARPAPRQDVSLPLAYPVADVNTQTVATLNHILGSVGSRTILSLGVAGGPLTLYTSDGTPAGTYPYAVLPPQAYIKLAGSGGGDIFYLGLTNNTLWRTDGTATGTWPVTEAFHAANDCTIFDPVRLDGIDYFAIDSLWAGTELWRSDGSAAGTWQVADLYPGGMGSRPYAMVAWHGALYFLAADGSTTPNGNYTTPDCFYEVPEPAYLFRSDGTAAGTERVRLPGQPPDAVVGPLVRGPNDLAFIVADQLWRTDGTAVGTFPLPDTVAQRDGWANRLPVATATHLVFEQFPASDDQSSELWSTDGTITGTHRLLGPWARGSWRLFSDGARVCAEHRVALGIYELWCTDGTPAGTRLAIPVTLDWTAHGYRVVNDVGYWQACDGLWRSDGTAAGTWRVFDSATHGMSCVNDLASVPTSSGETLLRFHAVARGRPGGIWFSDGTPAGTRLVMRDVRITGNSDPRHMIAATDAYGQPALAFVANAGDGQVTLFHSDGTAAGTRAVDRVPVRGLVITAGSRLLHTAFQSGNPSATGVWTLWEYDVASRVRRSIASITLGRNKAAVVSGERLYVATAIDGEIILWSVDLINGRVEQITSLISAYDQSDSAAQMLAADGHGGLFFVGDHPPTLYHTTGSAHTTRIVYGPPGGIWSTYPHKLLLANDRLYFLVPELWVSDGTAAGTQPVAFAGDRPDGRLWTVAALGRQFIAAEERAEPPARLWMTDGDPATMHVLAERPHGRPLAAVESGGRLFYLAADALGALDWWATDGTAAGTRLLSAGLTIVDDWQDSYAGLNGSLYFSADDGDSGYELWRSDGVQPAQRLTDTFPGQGSSAPTSMVGFGVAVALAADHPYLGRELWLVFPDSGAPRQYLPLIVR